jgi:PAS domain-containing protein
MPTRGSIAALPQDLPVRILDGSPNAILICDVAGTVRYWKTAAERILGFRATEVVSRRLRAVLPIRTGVLILDETSFPKQGPRSVAAARQILRRAGQGRPVPGGRDGGAVDGRPGLAPGRAVVRARELDPRCPAAARRADSGRPPVPGEVASVADAVAADPGQRGPDHRLPVRCFTLAP